MKCEHRFPSAANLNTFSNRGLWTTGDLDDTVCQIVLETNSPQFEHFMFMKGIFLSNDDSTRVIQVDNHADKTQ